jgi:hypothetical protein
MTASKHGTAQNTVGVKNYNKAMSNVKNGLRFVGTVAEFRAWLWAQMTGIQKYEFLRQPYAQSKIKAKWKLHFEDKK